MVPPPRHGVPTYRDGAPCALAPEVDRDGGGEEPGEGEHEQQDEGEQDDGVRGLQVRGRQQQVSR